jgi:hypothetical protein
MSCDNSPIIKAIKEAQEARILEQDRYRVILDIALKTEESWEDYSTKLEAIGGLSGMYRLMQDQQYPPTYQDWEEMGIGWQVTPQRKMIDKIKDRKVGCALYFYSEIADHTQRLSAMATYYQHFGATSEFGDLNFRVWTRQTVEKAMKKEPPNIA